MDFITYVLAELNEQMDDESVDMDDINYEMEIDYTTQE
ncbi:hypothetical protein R1080702_085 [Cyanophage S-RIM32]|uniref:Uncharacterized protein n=1 Tax=Cyanophage S-RIM32 TaxID=1278479 RepID=A0A127KLY1_9CAUD|nr:hypothetical protein BJD26_gp171 [Cyanophage S-RIM32]AMO43094.1 hypothetical protein R1080702_085 [Cyanophage S-RIM32]